MISPAHSLPRLESAACRLEGGWVAASEDPSLPLIGISVLGITSNIAGPFAGVILAHLGADVIKIGHLGGGPASRMEPLDGD